MPTAIRSVVAFQRDPAQQYVGVQHLTFPSPPLTPGAAPVVPTQPQRFPNRMFNKAANIPLMNIQAIYNYERAGRIQF